MTMKACAFCKKETPDVAKHIIKGLELKDGSIISAVVLSCYSCAVKKASENKAKATEVATSSN